jgi:LAO/AO transport system kinase
VPCGTGHVTSRVGTYLTPKGGFRHICGACSGRYGPAVSRPQDVADLVVRARRGEHRAVARLISLVETDSAAGRALLRDVAARLAPYTGRAHVVGLTGPPGVGKSTSTSALVTALRRRGRRVGVIAVDPSSPFSGGALLGDRVRMGEHATDEGVFIRSMASRGHLGGLAWSTPQALRVLDAAGCDVVLVETVGVGQSEVEVVALADTTVVLLAPGMGDGVQAAKAGILEVADVLAVNKADRDGARRTVRDLEYAIAMSEGGREHGTGWTRPVVSTVAVRGEGVDDLVAALDAQRVWLDETGARAVRRRARAAAEVEAIALEQVRVRIGDVRGAGALPGLADRVAAGELDPYRAADALLETALPAESP